MHVTTRYDYEPGPPPPGQDRRWRRLLLALGLVVALGIAVAVTWAIASDDGSSPAPGGAASPAATQAPTAATPASPTATTPAPPSATTVPVPVFDYQPLWPFRSMSAAAGWQQAYRANGSQPWHLDPGLTALGFAGGHLGFAAVNEETSRRMVGREAWVGVGYERPDGRAATAAVVHLARMGAGSDAPWEVAGTRDSTLSITSPGYGARVSSPVTAGGRITGVDESLRVAVIDTDGRTLGRVAGIPAGGEGTSWSATVSYTRPAGAVLTVVVSTGGHVGEVERFAVTAVRVPATS